MANETEHLRVLGMMSGSSLDGLDMAICHFSFVRDPHYRLSDWAILAAKTQAFPKPWQARLRIAPQLPAVELWRLHSDLGHWMGREAAQFIKASGQDVGLVGSHGHTVFHEPEKGFTTQIGDGICIAMRTQLPVVDQLRSADVAAGGQGAPIAPLADKWLFQDYPAFLNLGGIANVSLRNKNAGLLAGDVSAANQILDKLANLLGKEYDEGGKIAQSGSLLPSLYTQLQIVAFHQLPCPKSLDNGWVRDTLWPIIETHSGQIADKMHTFCRFVAAEIHKILLEIAQKDQLPPQAIKVLVTGGGTHNQFLMDCLRQHPQNDRYPLGFEAADPQLADFKEAAMVALAALHRYIGLPNTLASATGAARDTINGALYLPS